MFFQDIETGDIYSLLSKDDELVFLESISHDVFRFELDFFKKYFKQIKLVKNGSH